MTTQAGARVGTTSGKHGRGLVPKAPRFGHQQIQRLCEAETNVVQTEAQQRKAEEQEWEKKLAEAIDTDVLAGLKLLLEGRTSGAATGGSLSPARPEPLQAVEYD